MAKKTNSDPHRDREAEKYENPIASREFIISIFEKRGAPMKLKEVAHALGIEKQTDSYIALKRRLKAMSRDGQLLRSSAGQYSRLNDDQLIAGTVSGHPDGFGFLITGQGEDVFLGPREMNRVFDGDEVKVVITGHDPRGRLEGKIQEIVARKHRTLIGQFGKDGKVEFLSPANRRVNQDLVVIDKGGFKLKPGDWIEAEITEYPTPHHFAECKVIELIGRENQPGLELEVVIRNFDLPHEWPEAVLEEGAGFTTLLSQEDYLGRVDLRKLPFVTIDGEDAKDFDDAVYAEKTKSGGWKLYVAIADVAHYVQRDSAIDKEAYIRGNSVYFPEYVIPMLPEVLSNQLCSLVPEKDRLAMVCEMTISAKGKLSNYEFYEAVIHSHHRLTYTKVGALVEEPEGELAGKVRKELGPREEHIWSLYELFMLLHETRDIRGAIDFDTVETRIEFDEDRKIRAIVPVQRNVAHRIIEECMLCANVAAAKFIDTYPPKGLFRVHEEPKAEKVEALNSYLQPLGIPLVINPEQNRKAGKTVTPKDYQAITRAIADRLDRHVIQTMLLRSMNQAVYSPENKGHFGLAYERYTHFTSPIRRYPDLLTHRAIKSMIFSNHECKHVRRVQERVETGYDYGMDYMVEAGEHLSMTERRADDATRDLASWLKCEYMSHHVGEEFTGVISGVTGFGFFVELEDIYIEGLVHVRNLKGDYFQFDEVRHCLYGERSGFAYSMGDLVSVAVASVNVAERKIDLEVIERRETMRDQKRSKHGGKKPRSRKGRR